MLSNIIQEITSALSELQRMHQLNYELLEQLNVVCDYLQKNYPDYPCNDKLASLLSKSLTLISEIQASVPKTLQYQKLNSRKVTDSETNEEVTKPREAPPAIDPL